jgi:folate-binding protein YgfZ
MQTPTDSNPPHADNSDWAALQISGADRLPFLQGQLTQDVERLRPAEALLAGWASPKGRLLCVVWLIDWQDSVWMILPNELADRVMKRLQMFVLRSAVTISKPADVSVYPVGSALLPATEIPNISLEKSDINYCFSNKLSAIISPKNISDMALLISSTPANSNAPADAASWRQRCIAAGIPQVYASTHEEFVPQMLNLDLLDAISFTKGCYVGQEIVARTQNLGRIKRRMYAFRADAQLHLQPGQAVYSGSETVGQIVDSVADGGKTTMLAVIRIPDLNSNLSADEEGDSLLQRLTLPYEVPESI